MFQQKLRVWTPEIQQAHNEQRMAHGGDPGGAGKRGKQVQEMKQWEMNPIAGAVKRGADYASNLLDQGPSVRDVTSNLVGAIPFVGPDLRKAMEGSTTTVPVGLNMASNMPEEGFKYGEPAKYKKAGIETYKMPTTDLLDAMKVSDLVGTSGLSRAAESAGYGEVPDLMDVLDAAQVGGGLYGAAKLGAKGAKAAGKGALKVLEQAGTGPRSGSMAAQRGAVKLGGGNWVDTETNRAIHKLKPDESYPQTYIDSAKEDLAEYLKNPDLHPEAATEIERLQRDLAHMEQTNAFNKWVDTKVAGYVRNQMSTPDDPVIKMLDMRAAKIEADYATGQKRLAKLDERIAQAEATASTAEERNNLANMKRTRAQRASEVESDRDLAMNSMLPGGTDNAGYDYLGNNAADLINVREETGFPIEGYGQSKPAKAWEAAADLAAQIKPAKTFQNQEEKNAASKAAAMELGQYQNIELPDKFKAYLDSTSLSDKDKQTLLQKTPKNEMVRMIGESDKAEKLVEAAQKARSEVNMAAFSMAQENPYLAKLPPNTPVYNTYSVGDFGIDHIIDVLKDDIASGKMKLEDLNKITMDQAVKRAGEYDFEMAKKARDAITESRASMPVYKEYPEGYKWVQLTKPGEFNAESNAMGHSVRGYEPERGHPDWTPESGDSGREDYGHGGWEAIKSGKAKVYSLVDPSGKPHTTIEVKENPNPYPVSGEAFARLSPAEKAQFREHVMQWRRRNPDVEELTDEHTTQALKEAGVPPQPDIITQIKGKGNQRPQEKYDPYTQDFVRSGNWAYVNRNDLRNTGLIEHSGKYFTEPEFVEAAKKYGRMGVQDVPWEVAKQRHIEAGIPEEEALLNWVEGLKEGRGRLDIPEEGMKAGGEVRMSGGGLLESVVKAAKAAKAAEKIMPTARIGLEAPGILIPSKMNNVREAVRNIKGHYGARRVERAADEIPNLERMFQEDALKEVFTGDNARGVMTIDPADFEKYAVELKPRAEKGISHGLNVTGNAESFQDRLMQQALDKYDLPTNEYIQYLQRLQGGFSDVPYLNLFKDEVGLPDEAKVIGHEGRHRNRALAAKGDKSTLVQIQPRGDLREGMPRRTQEDFIEALRQELDANNRLVIPESEPYFLRPSVQLPDVYAKGGEVHMSTAGWVNDAMKAAKTAKAVAEAKSALPAPAVIPNLLKKSTASEIGREERARRQAAAAAEAARQELAKQTPVPVGYVTHTEKSPNPHVGYRYEADQPVGIVPSPTIDVGALERAHKGASMLPLPWDSTNRNVRVTNVSGEDLAHPIWSHGGIPYSSDEQHLLENIGGASGRLIANRILGREENARKENKLLGGTGEIIHAVNTMGKGGENYALPSSEFAFDVINRRVNNGDLTLKEADDLSNEIRNYVDPDTKKQPFKNWAGFISRDGAMQMYTGEGLNGPAGDLRKLIADKIIYKKKKQELLGFNAEDFVNAITYDPVQGFDRGYIGANLLSNPETSPMKLSKTMDFPWLNPYDTNFSATRIGQLEDLVPIRAVMSRQIAPIEQELLAKQAAKVNGKPYTPDSLQGSAISALEKRKDNVAQFMDSRFFQDLSDYMEALKTPLEKKKGGLARAKKPKKVARHGNTVSN